MNNKQTILLKDKEEDEIICVAPCTTSYVDEDYFNSSMGEGNPEDKSEYMTFATKF